MQTPIRLTYTFVASTSQLDRDNDRIDARGWDLDAFMRAGGPVLLNHDAGSLPVARGVPRRDGDRLLMDVTFPEPGKSARSDEARAMPHHGSLAAMSVGFRPKVRPIPNGRGGHDFPSAELLEVSLLPIPANPHAVRVRSATSGRITKALGHLLSTSALQDLREANRRIDAVLFELGDITVGEAAAMLAQAEARDRESLRIDAAALRLMNWPDEPTFDLPGVGLTGEDVRRAITDVLDEQKRARPESIDQLARQAFGLTAEQLRAAVKACAVGWRAEMVRALSGRLPD
jgi:hypothetical protein